MRTNRDIGFDFSDDFQDIVSDSNKLKKGSKGKRAKNGKHYKKKSKHTVFDKINKWWSTRKKGDKALVALVLVLFVIVCLMVIWTILPFQIRGRLFSTAFGFFGLSLLLYLCIHWKKRGLQKFITSFVSLIMSAIMVFTLFFWTPFIKSIYNYDTGFTDDAEELGAVPSINKDITNIALFGIDTRDTKSFSGNSDSIMILSLNAKTHKVKIISIMRDSLVPVTKNGKTSYGKINSAYQRGGAQLAVHTLNTIFNLDITEYATVNFFGMAQIIDGVGGIEVTLTENEVKEKRNVVNINPCIGEICAKMGKNAANYLIHKSGKQHLNGIQAVAYSRIRAVPNIWGTNNDFGRTDRQRYVMEQLFNKALTLKKSEYPALAKALIPYTVTSLSIDEILSFALAILTKSPTFEQYRVPQDEFLMTSPKGSFGSVVYYDLDYAADVIHGIIYDDMTMDEYIEQNGIDKNNWYKGGSSGSSGTSSKKPTTSSNSSSEKNNSSDTGLESEDSSSSEDTGGENDPEESSKPNETDPDEGSGGDNQGSSSESSSEDSGGGDNQGGGQDSGQGGTTPSDVETTQPTE